MTILIREHRSIKGPNVWTSHPITVLACDLGTPVNDSIEDLQTLAQDLTQSVLTLDNPETYYQPLIPIAYSIDRGLPGILGHLIINLQRMAEIPVEFIDVESHNGLGLFELVVQHTHESVGLAASRLATRMLNHHLFGTEPGFNLQQEFHLRFCTLVASRRHGTAARSVIDASTFRGIPVSQIDPSGRVLELGTGAYRRRIKGSKSSLTSAISDSIIADKSLTNHYLRSAGLPVPNGMVVRTLDQAIAAAHSIGFPLVVKPIDQGGSAGVSVKLQSNKEVAAAFPLAAAQTVSGKVLIEQYIAGDDYRVVVVNDRVVSVSQHIRASVVGDGETSIRGLIEIAIADPRRGKRESNPLRGIVIDSDLMTMLARQGEELDSIPTDGQTIWLKPTGKITTGGFSVDRTDDVHPENVAIFLQAAKVLSIDTVSMDVVAEEISASIWATSGAILELNAGSGFHNELYPGKGVPRDPGPSIVEMLFPIGSIVRAPILAVTGERSHRICEIVARVLTSAGRLVGIATRSGVVIDSCRIRSDDGRNPVSIGYLLNNAATQVLVAEIDQENVRYEGLGFDYCDVAVVTSLSALNTPYGRPVETVLTGLCGADSTIILNADEIDSASFLGRSDASVVFYSFDPANQMIRDHIEGGGRALSVIESGSRRAIVETSKSGTSELVELPGWSSEHRESNRSWLEVLVPALAAALAQGVPSNLLRQVLATMFDE